MSIDFVLSLNDFEIKSLAGVIAGHLSNIKRHNENANIKTGIVPFIHTTVAKYPKLIKSANLLLSLLTSSPLSIIEIPYVHIFIKSNQ
jgi:hypothetical protein